MIVYVRGTELVIDDKGATGRRGALLVPGLCPLPTMEREDNYIWIRPGTYGCQMADITFTSGMKSPAIRISTEQSPEGRLYIHQANWPSDLSGCICPGQGLLPAGVSKSGSAMSEIFGVLGGYTPGRRLSLRVYGDKEDVQDTDDLTIADVIGTAGNGNGEAA